MSPEQCRGAEVDARSDIYAMGCVMFETLTGVPPLYGSTMVETIMMQLNTVPPSLSEVTRDKHFPSALESVIATALKKDPDARFQNMKDLKLQLMQIHPDRVTRFSFARWRRRRWKKLPKLPLVAIASFLLGLSSLPIFWMSHHHRERHEHKAETTAVQENEQQRERDYERYRSWTGTRDVSAELATDEKIGKFLAEPRNANLRQLPLGGAIFLTDKGAASIRNLHSLQAASLENTMITDKTVDVLSNIPSLQLLSLRGTMITDSGVRLLDKLPNLQILLLSDTDITDKSLETVGKLKGLKELTLSDTAISDSGLNYLRGLKLIRFYLAHTGVTDAGMSVIENMTSLDDLHFNDTNIGDAGIAKVQNLTRMRELSFSNTQVSDKGLAYLENMQKLQILHAGCEHVTDAGMAHLKKLDSLLVLDLAGSGVGDGALPAIAQMDNLKELSLAKTNITDAGLAQIAKMRQLEGLDLSSTKITSEGIKQLGKLHGRLKVLMLSDCKGIKGSNNQMRQDLKTTIIFTTRYNLTEASQMHLYLLQRQGR